MEEGKLDYAVLLKKAFKYWYLYLVILAACWAGASFYLAYKQPVYYAAVKLLIEDDREGKRLSEETMFADLGFGKTSSNLINEMSVLLSSPLTRQVVEKLDLHYRYFSINGWKKREIYKSSPVEVLSWEPQKGYGYEFYGVLTADQSGSYRLAIKDGASGDETEYSGEFGKSLILPTGVLTLSLKEYSHNFEQIGIWIVSIEQMAAELVGMMQAWQAAEKSTMVELSMTDVAPQRIYDVLSNLVELYNQNAVDRKNQVFKNTIDIINTRIEMIVDELSEVEKDVELYKQRFSMTELSSEGTMLMTEVSTYNQQIAGTQLQLDILNSIEEFLEKNRNTFEFVPTNATITDLTLVNQIQTFNQLLSERERKRSELGPANPDLILIEKQLRNLRETILASIRSIKKDLNIALQSNQGVKSGLQSRLQSLPRRERELIEIERRKSIKENLYLYLLQKREESAISLAVTTDKSLVVEPPSVPHRPISPHRAQIRLIAIFLGLAIPSAIVFLFYYLNDKIQSEEEVERNVSVPVLGTIAQSRRSSRLVVQENSRSVAAETFRMLRANLSYLASDKPIKSLMITSSTSGEGKSFIAVNLGLVEALANKRVVILELDLRKPKQGLYLEIPEMNESEFGLVNYLTDPSLTLEDIVSNSGTHPGLDIIRCGPKPPNPAELLLSARLRELAALLQAEYDLVILDTPPVGLVADALQVKDLADVTMFVMRAEYTRRPSIRLLNNLTEKAKLPRLFTVLNGVKATGGYGYGYYGGRDYYYSGKSWWRQLFSRNQETGRAKRKAKRSMQEEKAESGGNGALSPKAMKTE